jgi:hypothetical protein
MRIDARFNKRTADQVEVATPAVQAGPQYELGMRVMFFATNGSDKGQLAANMSPMEALAFAAELVTTATRQLKYEQERAAKAK